MTAKKGDLVAWTANGRGIHLGIVYGFDINGNPMIIRHSDKGKQMVLKVCTFVIASTEQNEDPRLADAMDWWRDYDIPV